MIPFLLTLLVAVLSYQIGKTVGEEKATAEEIKLLEQHYQNTNNEK